jgi:colanic acid biosynthesis protein WcaH
MHTDQLPCELPAGVLQESDFAYVVRCAPLVCIDLVIRDPSRRVLVGLRQNEPAKGWFFVPGGRIRKGEKIEDALARILLAETGCETPGRGRFLGAFQHFYAANHFGIIGFGTHCIALAYEIDLPNAGVVPDKQHSSFKWLTEDEMISAGDVHDNTKMYFS